MTLTSLLSLPAQAGQFNFNYKNLNTLAMLICKEMKPEPTSNTVLVNKFTTNKTKYGSSKNDIQYEMSGICNSKISKKSSEVLSFGDEIQFSVDLDKANLILGTVGVNKLIIKIKGSTVKSITIDKIFENKKVKIGIPKTRWAKSDSLFSFNKNERIKMETKGRILASEKESNLYSDSGEVLYNIWNYESFGCHTTKGISQDQCEQFTQNL
jgi:hypothetical protein